MTYFILTQSFAQGLSAQDLSSLLARHLRVAIPDIRTEQIVQFPMVDGGEGMVETLVTLLLGAFLEVDATSASGGQVVVPIGFIGEESNIALLRLGSVAGLDSIEEPTDSTHAQGTTFGIGELIQDALDEGAFSVVLGLDEPVARDAGLGLAAALGVTFFDSENTPLDLSKPHENLFDSIARIDATGRPFEVLSARFFVARARKPNRTAALPTASLQESLERLNEILKRDCGITVDLSSIAMEGSGIEFGLQAFLTTEIHEGSAMVLQASGIEQKLKDSEDRHIVIAAESMDAVFGEEAFDAMAAIVQLADEHEIPMTLLLSSIPEKSKLDAWSKMHRSLRAVFALPDAPLFLAPLTASAGEEEIRRDQKMRIDKLAPKLFAMRESQTDERAEDSVRNQKNGAKAMKPQ